MEGEGLVTDTTASHQVAIKTFRGHYAQCFALLAKFQLLRDRDLKIHRTADIKEPRKVNKPIAPQSFWIQRTDSVAWRLLQDIVFFFFLFSFLTIGVSRVYQTFCMLNIGKECVKYFFFSLFF